MSVTDLTALLTALSVAVGAAWTIVLGRKQQTNSAASSLWSRAMDLIDRLTEENGVLKSENDRLREELRARQTRARAHPVAPTIPKSRRKAS